MIANLLETETAALADTTTKILAWREREGVSTAELLRRFRGLGSDRTLSRIARGDFAEVDVSATLERYRAVLALMESLDEIAAQRGDDELIDDLAGYREARRALLPVLQEAGNARLLVIEGDSGLGKSSIKELLQRKYGERIVVVECTSAWGDNANSLLGAILRALGRQEPPSGAADRLTLAVTLLRESRLCLILEEAHHLGPKSLNVVKTLINQTPGEFIFLTIPTLWRRLELTAYEEARQLTGNRLAERVRLTLRKADVVKLLAARLGQIEDIDGAAAWLCERAPRHGNLAFVRDVIRRVQRSKAEPSLETIVAAGKEECASR